MGDTRSLVPIISLQFFHTLALFVPYIINTLEIKVFLIKYIALINKAPCACSVFQISNVFSRIIIYSIAAHYLNKNEMIILSLLTAELEC